MAKYRFSIRDKPGQLTLEGDSVSSEGGYWVVKQGDETVAYVTKEHLEAWWKMKDQ